MKLKVPPAVVFLVFALLMYLLAEFLPVGYFDFFGRYFLIYALGCMACMVGLWAVLLFIRVKTTIDPTKPSGASTLVTGGLYQYSRNPMYLGLLLMLLAWALFLGNAFNVLLAAGFVGYMNKFQVIPEEEVLLGIFGKEYTHYCTLVRRWF